MYEYYVKYNYYRIPLSIYIKMSRIVLILGNGFDIDLGLKSRYSDFIESEEWKSRIELINTKFSKFEYFNRYSLLKYINKASRESNWFDIEEEIRAYAKEHQRFPDNLFGIVQNEFDWLRNDLKTYLCRISRDFQVNKERIAYILLNSLSKLSSDVKVLSFNYTNCFHLCDVPLKDNVSFSNVHNSIYDDDIVLGCIRMPMDMVNPSFSFFFKYNMLQKATHIYEYLKDAHEVIFFGHSMNLMDYCYFEDFFKQLSTPIAATVDLTFITLDKKSERTIRDNIDNVTALHIYLNSINFIHTESLYNRDKKEIEKWEKILSRIRSVS